MPIHMSAIEYDRDDIYHLSSKMKKSVGFILEYNC